MTARHPVNPWRELREIGDEEPDGVVLELVPLPSGQAWWVPEERVIVMRPGLLQVQRRCALAHELAHRTSGHSGQCQYGDSRRQGARAELTADQFAARQLITWEALADVLVWTDDRDEAADELWVTRRLLDVRLEHIHPAEWVRVAERLRSSLVAVLAACGTSGDESGPRKADPPVGDGSTTVATSAAPTPEADPTFPGGQPLSAYESRESYPWRAAIVESADELLAALRQVNPDLDEGDFSDVVSTCEDVTGGEFDTDQLLEPAANCFDVDQAKAGRLVGTSKRYACPS